MKYTRTSKTGLPAGTLIAVGDEKSHVPTITIASKHNSLPIQVKTIQECLKHVSSQSSTWIHVDGVHEPTLVADLGKHFKLHPLLLEDIMNTEQRPKLDEFDNGIFLVVKLLSLKNDQIKTEHVSFVLTRNILISFMEYPTPLFDTIRQKFANQKLAHNTLDFLLFSILDTIVDTYFVILEKIEEETDVVETKITNDPTRQTMHLMHELRKKIIYVKKAVWPVREVISHITRLDSKYVSPSSKLYYRDLYDHSVQIIDSLETIRDIHSNLLEVYMSSINNRMNEVMKVLTVIATIFIPLTFIASIYGMNFTNMPELEWKFGYYAVLGVMALIGIGMAHSFKRLKWL